MINRKTEDFIHRKGRGVFKKVRARARVTRYLRQDGSPSERTLHRCSVRAGIRGRSRGEADWALLYLK